jgi:hypothetical protein
MSMTHKFFECVFYERGKCNVFHSKKGDIHQQLVSVSMLNGDLHQHSLKIGVNLSSFTERSLIMNRMGVSDICSDNDMICPYHRYSYGLFWRPSTLCQSPYRDSKKPNGTRSLSPECYQKLVEIENFKGNGNYKLPVGQKVCMKYSTKIKSECDIKKILMLSEEDLCSTSRVSKV